MAEALSLAAEFQRFNTRKDDWTTIDPPTSVVALLLAREGQWRLPRIAGVITTPTLRPDGSLLSEPGYDPETQTLTSPRTRSFTCLTSPKDRRAPRPSEHYSCCLTCLPGSPSSSRSTKPSPSPAS